MDDKTLAEALVKKSLLLPETAQKLMAEAAQVRQPIENLIYSRRLINEAEVAKVKSEILGIPYKPVSLIKFRMRR